MSAGHTYTEVERLVAAARSRSGVQGATFLGLGVPLSDVTHRGPDNTEEEEYVFI